MHRSDELGNYRVCSRYERHDEQDFVVEMGQGGEHGVSAKVISGPANVGMEMMQSAMTPKDGGMVARVKHPANGEVYNLKSPLWVLTTGKWTTAPMLALAPVVFSNGYNNHPTIVSLTAILGFVPACAGAVLAPGCSSQPNWFN